MFRVNPKHLPGSPLLNERPAFKAFTHTFFFFHFFIVMMTKYYTVKSMQSKKNSIFIYFFGTRSLFSFCTANKGINLLVPPGFRDAAVIIIKAKSANPC